MKKSTKPLIGFVVGLISISMNTLKISKEKVESNKVVYPPFLFEIFKQFWIELLNISYIIEKEIILGKQKWLNLLNLMKLQQ